MSESAQLLMVLRRVRRRLRAVAALQGAVVGGLLGLAIAAVWVGGARWRGEPVQTGAIGLVAVGFVMAAAVCFALRRVSLSRCARALDRSLDGGDGGGHDRCLSALAFAGVSGTAFTRAAIADALRRGRQLPMRVVVPLRRPRGLFGLGLAALVFVAATVAPARAPAGRRAATSPAPRRAEAPLRMDPASLEAEREEARAAEKAASQLDDSALGELARAFARAVRELTDGVVPRGEALDQLAELQKRAEELAAEAEELERGLERAAAAMKESPATKAAGDALAAKDPAATEKAMSELAARASSANQGERDGLARTLDEASKQAAGARTAGAEGNRGQSGEQKAAAGNAAGDEEPQRRLARERSSSSMAGDPAAQRRAGERRLQRLQRDLDEAAAACRDNPESCRRKLQDSARELPRMENELRSSEWRRRVSAAVRQLRERLRRDAAGRERGRQREERQFSRAARGGKEATGTGTGSSKGKGTSGDNTPTLSQGQGQGDEGDSGDELELEMSAGDDFMVESSDGESASSMQMEGAGSGDGQPEQGKDQSGSAASANNGNGIGNQAGKDPLGARDNQTTRGREREAAVRSGAGPTRAQVIEAAAARGFARGGYRGVFQDYEAVVEESLDASAVPPGRRYVVRRYFQLIRPRTSPPRSK